MLCFIYYEHIHTQETQPRVRSVCGTHTQPTHIEPNTTSGLFQERVCNHKLIQMSTMIMKMEEPKWYTVNIVAYNKNKEQKEVFVQADYCDLSNEETNEVEETEETNEVEEVEEEVNEIINKAIAETSASAKTSTNTIADDETVEYEEEDVIFTQDPVAEPEPEPEQVPEAINVQVPEPIIVQVITEPIIDVALNPVAEESRTSESSNTSSNKRQSTRNRIQNVPLTYTRDKYTKNKKQKR